VLHRQRGSLAAQAVRSHLPTVVEARHHGDPVHAWPGTDDSRQRHRTGLLESRPARGVAGKVPLGRFGASEVVEMVLFLSRRTYVTGEVLCCDGGRGWAS